MRSSQHAPSPISSSTSQPLTESHPCSGKCYLWDIGSPYTTYPFPRHDPQSKQDPGYTLLSVDVNHIYVRSRRCTMSLPSAGAGGTCSSCAALVPALDLVKDGARAPSGKRSVNSLSHAQIADKALRLTKKANKLKRDVSVVPLPHVH